MGSNCCKEIRVESNNTYHTYSTSKNYISWIRGNRIGKGASATVYKAIETETGSLFAVKSISLKNSSKDQSQIISAIQQEVDILKTLNHPNIMKFYQTDIDIENKEIFIICEYAPYGNLLSFIQEFHPLPISLVQRFTRDLLKALEYIHEKGVIHRDIKCENILVDKKTTLKLADFGLSKLSANKTAGVAGSLFWMAPEVFLGAECGVKSDVWALGCAVVEMVTGCVPWSDVASNAKELVSVICKPNCFGGVKTSTESLNGFLRMCFCVDPGRRPSASELLKHEFIGEVGKDGTGASSFLNETGC